MFDSKKKESEGLELGDINLLPDEMRSAADKYQKSKSSKEALYQLRTPKKERRRRNFLAWLPFFGGAHWEVTQATAEKKPGVPTPEYSGIAVETNQQQAPNVTPTSNEFGVIKPVFGTAKSKGFSPKAKPSRTGMFFASFFKKQRPIVPATAAPDIAPVGPKSTTPAPQSTFTAPSRHYSLLSEETLTPEHHEVKAPLASAARSFDESVSHGIRPITPEAAQKHPHVSHERVRSPWTLPAWLDLFGFLAKLFGKKPSQSPVKPREKMPPAPLPPREMPPSLKPIQAIAPEGTRGDVAGLAISQGPLTPAVGLRTFTPPPSISTAPHSTTTQNPILETQKPAAKRTHAPWRLPKWLDIFYLLSLLTWKRAAKPSMKAQPIVVPPAPQQTAKAPLVTPSPTPAQMPPIPQPPIAAPEPAITSASVITPVPQSRPAGAPPPPEKKIESHGNTPLVDSVAPTAKKQKVRGSLFHFPDKPAFASASKELRDINLIPGVFAITRTWKQIGQLVGLVALASCGVVGLVYGGLELWKSQLEKRTVEVDREIAAFRDDIIVYNKQEPEMSSLGNRVDVVLQLLGRHVYWTRFFTMLETYTLPDVYYDGISATTNGTLSLSAHGSDFSTVTKQLQLLSSPKAQEFVTKASITGAQLSRLADGQEQVTFSIELTLNPDVFYYHARNQ